MTESLPSPFADLAVSSNRSNPSRRLGILCESRRRCAFILNAFLESSGKLQGIVYHEIFGEWLTSGIEGEDELAGWLRERLGSKIAFRKKIDRAFEKADRWCEEDFWVAALKYGAPPSDALRGCPRLIFGKGSPSLELQRAAVFNSRKPRSITPCENWLTILRSSLPLIASTKAGIMGSLGTITYDLVSSYAFEAGLDLSLFVPFPVEDAQELVDNRFRDGDRFGCTLLSCLTRSLRCSKQTRMVCRDRLIAFLSDFHLAIEISYNGNLSAVLERQQKEDPRPQLVYRPEEIGLHTKGNVELLENFPRWSRPFDKGDIGISREHTANAAPEETHVRSLQQPVWTNYLYHYTRSCPGAWPGQTYREYLLSLLENSPTAGHTALDTLIRILSEGCIRASSRIVRGDKPVVCFSAKSPLELESVRRWNPGLIRWTFEPYGIALSRRYLRRCDAKPVVYARNEIYTQLRSSERYRFQRHEPPRCLWKHEREWRIQSDLLLHDISSNDWFVFVPDRIDAESLVLRLGISSPVVILAFCDPAQKPRCLAVRNQPARIERTRHYESSGESDGS